MDERTREALAEAAVVLRTAEALILTAGAGMGVDSGLPDFRGDAGFWRAYPPFARLGLSFVDLANPAWFARDPCLAWGFYGHRLNLYRRVVPHDGFSRLLAHGTTLPAGMFVFTSNVDGHFQRAGFATNRIVECHGSIHHLQCCTPCGRHIWPADSERIEVDETSMRATPTLPTCPRCGGLARPNVLMFGDWTWIPDRSKLQQARLERWLGEVVGLRVVVVEIGAGSAVPTVRMTSEQTSRLLGARLIRINPRQPQAPPGHISLALSALDALPAILPAREDHTTL
jgi:NAD-dependent SIR2 family protein deacetylase